LFLVTGRAAHAQKTMLQAPALEVVLEFPLNIVGQWFALRGHQVREGRIVLCNKLVEEGLFRAMPLVTANTILQTGFPASRQWRHECILATGCFSSG
jgi:hypothetical protein